MPRRTFAADFDALAIEGGILPPEWLSRIAALDAGEQCAVDYQVPPGLELRDELTRYWRIAQALHARFVRMRTQARDGGSAASQQFIRELLGQVFGFEDLSDAGVRTVQARDFEITFEAAEGRVPIVVGSPANGLDTAAPAGGRRRSTWSILQEYLNASDEVLWGLATNGTRIRLGRDNTSLTRPAWLEADLDRIFAEERFADFSVLWLVLHASRFGPAHAAPGDAPLERWREAARAAGTRARMQLRNGVEAALLALGQGYLQHPANVQLRGALTSGQLQPVEFFNELLRTVYRMIFLLTIEERGILHGDAVPAEIRDIYATGYGMRRLRERAVRRSQYDRHIDLWRSLQPVFAGLGRSGGEPLLGLPELGGLFAHSQCPHLDEAELENRALLEAVFKLAWLRESAGLARVNWKDMGPEELGSVYESLLELVPQIGADARTFQFAGREQAGGNQRRESGSYYTPDSLVQQLLDTALEPVIEARMAAQPQNPEDALLSITVIDPACGSGHFLLGAARRLATRLASIRSGGTPGAQEYRNALRDVVTHCIHGVDANPMALELARMALWLESFTPDRALGFLDHHLVLGNSLLGLLDFSALQGGIPGDAFNPLSGDDREVARVVKRTNNSALRDIRRRRERENLELALGMRHLREEFDRLDALADDDIAGGVAKRGRYDQLRREAETSAAALAADVFMAAFLLPKKLLPGERALTEAAALQRFPTTGALLDALDGTLSPEHSVARAAREVCVNMRVLHWPLAFPQVFARGGFDVVIGNPPWEILQLSEEEFFATRAPEIAELPGARRKRAIESLQTARPELWSRYVADKFRYDAGNNCIRNNPRFQLTAVGKLNMYALFAETFYRTVNGNGRAGVIVPTGIATDDSTKHFFGDVVQNQRLVSLFDFENREALFDDVHRSYKFCLFTIGQAREAEFAFFLTQVTQLADDRRRFTLTPEDFRLINPNTLTCPVFRSRMDAELTKKIYRKVPVLIDETKPEEEGNPWGLSFSQGLFNMTSDSALFLDRPERDSLPLYEAKMIHQFDHRWATYERAADGSVDARDVTDAEKSDPHFVVTPRYWVKKADVTRAVLGDDAPPGAEMPKWFMGWRDITNATNERTVIASVIPQAGVGHTLPLLVTACSPRLLSCLLANLTSLVFDYITRQKIGGTHLTYGYIKQLPIIYPASYAPEDVKFLLVRVLELTYTADDLRSWAQDLGYNGDPFPWNPERRAQLRAELDAYYAQLYGLTREELRYILDPADVMRPDYPSETFRVLKNNEEARYGEYRTRRLVLEAWDRLEAAGWRDTTDPVTAEITATR